MPEFVKDLNVKLHMDADTSAAEDKLKKFQQTTQGPLGAAYGAMGPYAGGSAAPAGSMTQELAQGQMRDIFREFTTVIKELTSTMKGGGGGAPGAVPDSGGNAPAAPGGATGPGILGRKSLAPWEVQRLMSDPAGGLWGMAQAGFIGTAGRMAMGGAGEGLAALGGFGSLALGGTALVAGLKMGDMINQKMLSDGEEEVQRRMRDNNLSAQAGLDIRGSTFNASRNGPGNIGAGFNYDYFRAGLGGLGVHLGDMAVGDRSGMPGFLSGLGVGAHQLGVSQEGLAGFIGQSWASGAADKTMAGSSGVLARIEAAIRMGNAIGIQGNDTLHAVASMLQLEQTRSGVVSPSAMAEIIREQAALGGFDKHLFGGARANGVMGAIGNNMDPVFQGGMLNDLLGSGGLTSAGRSLWAGMPHNKALDSLSDADKANILRDNPAAKRAFAMRKLQGEWRGLPRVAQIHLLGLSGVSRMEAYSYIAAAEGGMKGSPAEWGGLGAGFSGDQGGVEDVTAHASQNAQFANSGASFELLKGLLDAEAEKKKFWLQATGAAQKKLDEIALAVDTMAIHSWTHPPTPTPIQKIDHFAFGPD